MNRLVIIGAGGHGIVVAEAAADSKQWAEVVFLDDNISEASIAGFPVLGPVASLDCESFKDSDAIVAIGDNAKRICWLDALAGKSIRVGVVEHPMSCVSRSAKLGDGVVLLAGSVVNARATIGRGAILNTSATVDHDCVIGDGVHISPGANLAGNVEVGRRSWIGIGASIREGVKIGENAIVGAGAAVVSDVSDGATVGGVPAREL